MDIYASLSMCTNNPAASVCALTTPNMFQWKYKNENQWLSAPVFGG